MPTHDPATLDSTALGRRLHELVGDERKVQVEFLLHLEEFDRRQAFLPAGFGSLWDYCLKSLHLREGAAGRRIGAMRVLRRFPALEVPLRDGRLCLSTASLLGPVLTDANLEEMVSRAAFLTKAEVDHLVASVRPRVAPRDGVRLVSTASRGITAAPAAAPATALALPQLAGDATERGDGSSASEPIGAAPPSGVLPRVAVSTTPEQMPEGMAEQARADGPALARKAEEGLPARRAEVQAVSRDRWSLRVTLDAALKKDLEDLTALLSHKVPTGEVAEVLREAVHCAIEKHGKRRGAVVPKRVPSAVGNVPKQESGALNGTPQSEGSSTTGPDAQDAMAAPQEAAPAAAHVIPIRERPRAVPRAVRREVWKRDGGRCTFEGEDGRRCESTWQLELDHIDSAALGGEPTAKNLRLRCRKHNVHHAEEVFGREYMARYRSIPFVPLPGRVWPTSPGG
jgi:hypothetical protein